MNITRSISNIPEGNYCKNCRFRKKSFNEHQNFCILLQKVLFVGRKKDGTYVGAVKHHLCNTTLDQLMHIAV